MDWVTSLEGASFKLNLLLWSFPRNYSTCVSPLKINVKITCFISDSTFFQAIPFLLYCNNYLTKPLGVITENVIIWFMLLPWQRQFHSQLPKSYFSPTVIRIVWPKMKLHLLCTLKDRFFMFWLFQFSMPDFLNVLNNHF